MSDDMTWKNLCLKHDYQRRLSEVQTSMQYSNFLRPDPPSSFYQPYSAPATSVTFDDAMSLRRPRSYKSHFKQRYLVDAAWRTGGRNITKNITQEGGVVTSLHLTKKYIIVALDNTKIHVFDTEGNELRTLRGHMMGVWAMVPWDDVLVSGGCDRDVRVWDLTTG